MTHVILAELVAIDRFHRSIAFPFVHGYLRQRQVTSQWLRLGLPAGWRAAAELAAPELERLVHAIGGADATHVLFNQSPGEDVAAGLAALGSPPEAALLAEGLDVDVGSWAAVQASQAGLDRFVGLDSADDGYPLTLFDAVAPDFSWEPVNDAARAAPSLPFLICGDECNYRRGVTNNPYFRDLDLSACSRDRGCAFCVHPGGRATWSNDVLTLARRQLAAITATHPPSDQRLQIRAVGAPILGDIDGFARAVCDLDLPPADFLLDARADTLVAARPKLESALAALASTQHRLHLALIGIESFVDRELQRLNKGTTWRHNLAAIRTLFELEHDYPDHFVFREHGGLSLILYTPWTELEDLALNLAVVDFCDIANLCGKLFTARLRLYPSIPLGQLAIRDGLVREAYDDALLDTARRNFYADELPWRFAQPALEGVNRALLRLVEPGDDAISEALRAIAPHDPLKLALALVDAAIRAPEVSEPVAIIAAAKDLLAGVVHAIDESAAPEPTSPPAHSRAHAPAVGSSSAGWSAPPGGLVDSHGRHVVAVKLELKPVARIEAGNFPDEVHRQWIESNVPVVRYRTDHDGRQEMFIGRDADAVERALRATDAQRQAADEATYGGATREVGTLLGYPACCTEEYLRHNAHERESYTWLHLMVRLAAGETVSPLANPGHELVEHVPCSPNCEPSLAKAARLLDALGELHGAAAVDAMRVQIENPWLFLIDYQGEAIELRPDGDLDGRFRYASGVRRGGRHLLHRVAEGDEMVIDEQQLYVLRQGKLHAALGGRAFIWYHRAVLQREFWEAMVDVKFGCRRLRAPVPVVSHARGEEEQKPAVHTGPTQSRRIAAAIQAALAEDAPGELAGYRVRSVEQEHHTRATVILARPDGSIRLLVAPSSRAPHAYARAGGVAVMTERGEQVDTPDKDRAVRALARVLGARILDEEQLLGDG